SRRYFAIGEPFHHGIYAWTRPFFAVGPAMFGTISLAGQRARITQRDGARLPPFPGRTDSPRAPPRPRQRRCPATFKPRASGRRTAGRDRASGRVPGPAQTRL